MASEARLHEFMNHSPSLMFIKDREGRYLHVNENSRARLGSSSRTLSPTPTLRFSPLSSQHSSGRTTLRPLLLAQASRSRRSFVTCDGLLHTSIVHKFPIFDGNGQVTALGGVATDITERKRLEKPSQKNLELRVAIQTEIALREHQEHLRLLATHDALTGVPNRALLHQRAEHAIAVSRRSSRLLALLFIDLDRFKDVNDNHGHAAGDEVLREVASRLAGCLREMDTIARHGGDEFVVLLEEIEEPDEVEQIIGRMREVLIEPIPIEGREVFVTSSIGVALYPRDGEEMPILIRRADRAMYRAKERGRNAVQLYTPDLDSLSPSDVPLVRHGSDVQNGR